MSSKKKGTSTSGIQSFFHSTNAPKKTEIQNIVLIDDDSASSTDNVKCNENVAPAKNPFFMTKAEKFKIAAQEREIRIQEKIARNRVETNQLLASKDESDSCARKKAHAFFEARTSSTKSTERKFIQNLCSDESGDAVIIFPTQRCVGLDKPIEELQEHVKKISTFHEIQKRAPKGCYSYDSGKELYGGHEYPDMLFHADWGQLGIGNCFFPNKERRACGPSRFGPANAHPLAQSTLNLRAAWSMWISQLPPLEKVDNCSVIQQTHPYASPGQIILEKWLRKWAEKRPAESKQSAYGNTTPHSSLRKNEGGSTGSKCKSKQTQRGRRRSSVCSDESSIEFSSEDEWSGGDDKYADEDEDEDEDEDITSQYYARNVTAHDGAEGEILENIMVIEGSSGCGKSNAVRYCAALLGFKVIEVNAGDARSGSAVKKTISEAAQSNSANTAKKNLILFDEIDIVFEEEGDTQLYSAIQQIARISKCPILLTTERPLPFFKALHAKHVLFKRPITGSDESNSAILALANCATGLNCTPRESLELRALHLVSAGDARATLATIQCFSSRYTCVKTVSSASEVVVDLTDSSLPASVEVDSTNACFHTFLRDNLALDFAIFDSLYCMGTACAEHTAVYSKSVLVAPVVSEVSPRSGLCSGGFTVSIRGGNFLQASTSNSESDELAEVCVKLGLVYCPCVVKSDSLIVAYVPPIATQGVHLFVVEVYATVMNNDSKPHRVRASSEIAGIGGSWIQLFHRSTPPLLLRAKLSTSAMLDTPVTVSSQHCDHQSVCSGAATCMDEGLVSDTPLKNSPSDRKRCSAAVVDKLFESTISEPAVKRSKLVINDETDEERVLSSISSPELVHDIPNYVSIVEDISSGIQYACKMSLMAMLENSLSDPFLEPICDEIAEGYSLVVSRPMDLETILRSIDEGLYSLNVPVSPDGGLGDPVTAKVFDLVAYVRDVRLVWSNCILYNGPSSCFVRSAFVLNSLFKDALKCQLQSLAERNSNFHFFSMDGKFQISVDGVPELALFVEDDDVFEHCSKLVKSLSTARIQTLLSEGQRCCCTDSLYLTQEQALSPELEDVDNLTEQLKEAVKRRLAVAETPLGTFGIEYESDISTGFIPVLSQKTLHADYENVNYDSLCDANILRAAAWKLNLAACNDCDENFQTESFHCDSHSPSLLSPSFAQRSSTAARISTCSSVLLSGLHAALNQIKISVTQNESKFFHHQVKRCLLIERIISLANWYTPTYSSRAVDIKARICNEQIYSNDRVPVGFLMDVFPLITKMCEYEHILDVQLSKRPTYENSHIEYAATNQRATRRSKRYDVSRRELYSYMRDALNCRDHDLMSAISTSLRK